jgi:TIR domain
VFLSYSGADKQLAHSIAAVLRDAGMAVYDHTSIGAGEHLLSAITEQIEQADAIVLLISEASRRSEWIRVESSLAVGSALSGTAKIILPVLVGVRRDIPTELADIKALQVHSDVPPDQVGLTVLNALEHPTSVSMNYLYDSIALQTRSLRRSQELEELRLQRRTIEAGRRSRVLIMVITLLMAIGFATAFGVIVLRGSTSKNAVWWLPLVSAFLAGAFTSALAYYLGNRPVEESKTAGDE